MALVILKTMTAKTTMVMNASSLAQNGVASPAPPAEVATALPSAPPVPVVVGLGEAWDAVERPSMNQKALDQNDEPLLLWL